MDQFPPSWHRWQTLSCEYLREFSKKFETTLMINSGAWGKLIREKNQKSKISLHCPFKNVNVFSVMHPHSSNPHPGFPHSVFRSGPSEVKKLFYRFYSLTSSEVLVKCFQTPGEFANPPRKKPTLSSARRWNFWAWGGGGILAPADPDRIDTEPWAGSGSRTHEEVPYCLNLFRYFQLW